MCNCILEEEHKDHTVNPSLGQKQRSLVIELRKNVWNLNKTRPKVAIVIGEGSNRIKEGFSAFTMQDPKWQTVIKWRVYCTKTCFSNTMDSYLFLKKSNSYFTFFKIFLRDCLNFNLHDQSGNISFDTLCKLEFFNQNTSVSQSNTFTISKLRSKGFIEI